MDAGAGLYVAWETSQPRGSPCLFTDVELLKIVRRLKLLNV